MSRHAVKLNAGGGAWTSDTTEWKPFKTGATKNGKPVYLVDTGDGHFDPPTKDNYYKARKRLRKKRPPNYAYTDYERN